MTGASLPVRLTRGAETMLVSVSAKETAEKIGASRDTILRMEYAGLARNEERKKTQRSDIPVDTVAGLLPTREVVEPPQDRPSTLRIWI